MANYYVRSTDGDNGNAGTYDAPKLDIAGALAASGDGDFILCSHLHARAYTAATTHTFAGQRLLSVTDWGTPGSEPTPAYQAGASETCAGTATAILTFLGSGYSRGVSWQGGATNSSIYFYEPNNTGGQLVFRDSVFTMKGNAVGRLGPTLSNVPGRLVFHDCTFSMNIAAPYRISVRAAHVEFHGGGLSNVTSTAVFNFPGSYGHSNSMLFDGFDFSAAGASTLFELNSQYAQTRLIRCYRCRSHASAVLVDGIYPHGGTIEWIECDHGTNFIRQAYQDYQGTVTEDTVRIRDNSNSTYSHKLVSSAYTQFYSPLRSFPVARLNVVEGTPITVRVEVMTDGVTLTNGDFWPEVSYLGNASHPLGSLASGAKADILASASNLTTSTEGWTTTDISSPVKQYSEVTFTPQKTGIIEITACLAKASTTAYVDPDATVS